jgi:hypothetical protein
MGRLTVRLPDTLHQQIEGRARHESISLNQYIVYALTRQTTLAYTIEPVSEEGIREQRAQYVALLEQLGPSTYSEVERALDAREPTDDAAQLSDDVLRRLRNAALERLQASGDAEHAADSDDEGIR